VTPEDLRRVAAEYLRREKLTRVSLDPEEAAATASAAPALVEASQPFSRFDLNNGSRLLMQQNRRLPNVHLRVILRGGPLYENAESRGATSILATLLTKDTQKR